MRLIDADALIEDLKKWKGLDKTIEAVLETINKQPTSYDLEAVVEELQNMHLPLASQTIRIVKCIRKGGV